MNKITIDNITEQQLEDMIEIINKIKTKNTGYYGSDLVLNIKDLTFRAQQTWGLIRNQ